MSYRIKFYNYERIINAPHSDIIIKMMMASNDIQTADALFKLLGDKKEKEGSYLFENAHIQFIARLQISILREVIYGSGDSKNYIKGVIESIKELPQLNIILQKCSYEAQRSFENLLNCCKGRKDEPLFKKYAKGVRDKVGFHYDKKKIKKALQKVSLRKKLGQVQISDHISKWRFQIGDTITDEIVCSLWEIKPSKKIEETDDVSVRLNAWTKDYLEFSGNYILEYLSYYVGT